MATSNPYQAPTSDITSESSNETYQPKIFTTKGRIGRLRYLAYFFAAYLLMLPFGMLAGVIASVTEESGTSEDMSLAMGILFAAFYVAFLVFSFVLAKRRFNDLNVSGWFSLLLIIPLVNLFVMLWLLFGPGKPSANRFGPAPNKNPISVVICGLIMPVVFIGILAAISIPAYQDYVERAKAAEASLYAE